MNYQNPSHTELLLFGFFSLYLYTLEENADFLNRLKSVNFYFDEANADKELKLVIKKFMLEYPTLNFPKNSTYQLVINSRLISFDFSEFMGVSIKNVYLPEELTVTLKNSIKSQKSSIYVHPDLYIELQGIEKSFAYMSLELKSTKQDKIPGSSAQQANPYEWTIFVKHTHSTIEVATGLYANTITGKLPFPDRSPRPQVSFLKLKEWNKNFRVFNEHGLKITLNLQELENKANIISDWEKTLTQDWLSYVKSNKKPNKWFDNTMRIFVAELMFYYESLDDLEKEIFLKNNHNLIK